MTAGDTDDEGFLKVTLVAEGEEVDPLSLPGGYRGRVLAGRYRMGGVIGRGGASEVYAAEDVASGEEWAVKVLLPHVAENAEHTRRFKREARAAALMDHPNVLRVAKLVEDVSNGAFFIVMELGVGRSLATMLRKRAAVAPLSFVGDVMAAVLDVTAFAHERGVLHRDLKPENVFLCDAGVGRFTPKVLDFGLARIAHEGGSLTGPSMIRGTPHYMSPEQCRSLSEVGPESDVYAIGCMLFELLSGQVPFDAGSAMEILARQMFASVPVMTRPTGADAVPDALTALVAQMMAKDAIARPTARACRERLLAALGESGVTLGAFALPPDAAVDVAPSAEATELERSLAGRRVALAQLSSSAALDLGLVEALRQSGAKVDLVSAEGVSVVAASGLIIDAGDDASAGVALASRVRRARPAVKLVVVARGAAVALVGISMLTPPVTLAVLARALAKHR